MKFPLNQFQSVGSPPMNLIPLENGGDIVEYLVKAIKLSKNNIKTFSIRTESIIMVAKNRRDIEVIV